MYYRFPLRNFLHQQRATKYLLKGADWSAKLFSTLATWSCLLLILLSRHHTHTHTHCLARCFDLSVPVQHADVLWVQSKQRKDFFWIIARLYFPTLALIHLRSSSRSLQFLLSYSPASSFYVFFFSPLPRSQSILCQYVHMYGNCFSGPRLNAFDSFLAIFAHSSLCSYALQPPLFLSICPIMITLVSQQSKWSETLPLSGRVHLVLIIRDLMTVIYITLATSQGAKRNWPPPHPQGWFRQEGRVCSPPSS